MNKVIAQDLELVDKFQKEIILLGQTSALLHWDNQTYMPASGMEGRAEQLSFLQSLIHKRMTDDLFFAAVNRLQKVSGKLDDDRRALIRKLHKTISKSRKLPAFFVEELSKTCSLSFDAWKRAREKKDWEIFRPHLEKVVALKRQEARYYNFSGHPYNSLLDEFEEGMTVEKLSPLFDQLKKGLLDLLDRIEKSEGYKKRSKNLEQGSFSREGQLAFAKLLTERLGLANDFSRLDISEHPFSTKIGKGDFRITTNVRDDPYFSIGSTIHESGHALYERGMSATVNDYSFLCEAPSYGLHESQSRFWELMIGLSQPFWNYFFPLLSDGFTIKENFSEWYKKINQVRKGPIRIEADEVHYCLHIILRFELERDLISGKLEVGDLKKVWNKKIGEYFGISVKDDKEGVLQDVHWSEGYFGYFPSYAIGTIYAAQLFLQLTKDHPALISEMSNGDFSGVRAWLQQKVHHYGSRKLADEIIKQVCGKGLSIESFLSYLDEKYGKLYGF